jgi:hypothetical protein
LLVLGQNYSDSVRLQQGKGANDQYFWDVKRLNTKRVTVDQLQSRRLLLSNKSPCSTMAQVSSSSEDSIFHLRQQHRPRLLSAPAPFSDGPLIQNVATREAESLTAGCATFTAPGYLVHDVFIPSFCGCMFLYIEVSFNFALEKATDQGSV